MPIGQVWIYRLLFLFVWFSVCTVTDFSAEDKASGVKFYMVVHRRRGPGISHFGELGSTLCTLVGMCEYTAVPENGRTCYKLFLLLKQI